MSGSQQLLLGGSVQQAVDPFFYSVTSLLHGDGTNGGQNNTFLDSSTNNFTITRNGNTTQGSFSPFSQTGWGLYQPAVPSDYLNFTTSAGTLFQFTGDYTIEAWVFPTVLGSDTSIWVTNDGSANYHAFNIDATNYNIYLNSGSPTSSFSHGLQVNQWNHVAMVRNGSTITVYTNGVSRGTITNSSTNGYSSPTLARIGGGAAGSSRYLSNLRIVKGTAVYTAAFTPPTTPLTAISGTSLLTCQANRFLDASSNALVATVTGSPSVQPFSPFNPTTAYSTSAVGGSGYFDGSGDYVSAATASALQLTNAVAWTIEFWFYANAMSSQQFLLHGYDPNPPYTGYGIGLGTNGNPNTTLAFWDGTTWRTIATGLTPSQWYHVAISYEGSGTTGRMFLNGTQQGSAFAPASTINNTSNAIAWGAQNNNILHLNGYISGARIVKGTAVYTASFTAPTAPPTAITNTSLLLNFTNGAIFDNAAVADYETVGNAQISTSVKKYGTGSIAFDGSGDRLVGAPIQTRAPGTGDFCYEFWFYANTSSNACLFDTRAVNNNTTGFACLLNGSSQIALYTNSTILTCGLALSASIWYHIAVTRTAGVIKVFVNGTVVGTLANTNNFSDRTLQLGQYIDSTGSLNGYIDDFRSSNGIGRYAYNFTPPTAEFPNIGGTVTLTADPYFDYTTLLLPGNGTNGAQNNTFLDSSTNNFTITRNGNTTQGTFSPFSQTGWSNNFGSANYLSAASNAAFAPGTGDFTVEAWINHTSAYTTYNYILGVAVTGGLVFYVLGGVLVVRAYNVGDQLTSTYSPPLNQWTHVAAVRSGTTLTIYANGTAVASTTNSYNFAQGAAYIANDSGNLAPWYGYISNLRMVKGTAVYTSNFTPSTTPLTAISGTSLLTCQSNRFIDNSTNAFAITRSGSPTVQAFSPFNPTAAWSAATNGGSGYFDGSGDYLTLASNTNLAMGSGDFTVEFWIYKATSGTQSILDYASTGGFGCFITDTQITAFITVSTTYPVNAVVPLNSWNHIAFVRSGTTLTTYLNGVSQGTNTTSTNFTSPSTLFIGRNAGAAIEHLNGYLSGLRLIKGSAVTPTLTAPPTAVTNTQLLCNFTNAGIYDATSKNDLETVGNAQISTTQSKFGGSSMYFDGTGDYLVCNAATNNLYAFGTGDFTLEMWVYFNSVASGSLFEFRPASTNGAYPLIYFSSSGVLTYYANSNPQINSSSVSTGQWYHIALCRYGTATKMYLNGIQTGSTYTDSSNYLCRANGPLIGVTSSLSSDFLNGYVDDFRITKGIARYTSNFTPPTTAFLTQ